MIIHALGERLRIGSTWPFLARSGGAAVLLAIVETVVHGLGVGVGWMFGLVLGSRAVAATAGEKATDGMTDGGADRNTTTSVEQEC